MVMSTRTDCPACAAGTWQPWRSAGSNPAWRYVQCSQCTLVRIDPFPQAEQLAEVFDEGYFVGGGSRGGYADYDADAVLHRVNAAARLDALPDPSPAQPGRSPGAGRVLVDVGCASGYTLDEAVRRGWTAVGVEVSAQVAAQAQAKGHRVEPSLAELADLTGQVDAVCFFQVLEHLPDPLAALTTAAALLRPGGVVICETWDGASLVSRISGRRWQQLSPPSVLWVFDRPSVRGLLTAAGLTPRSWRRTSKVVSLGLVLAQSGLLAGLKAGALASLLARVRLRYGLGDLVMFVASSDAPPDDGDPDSRLSNSSTIR